MEWYCCLLREGTSDDPLAESLQKLLVSLTGDPVSITIREDIKGTTAEKILILAAQDAGLYDIVFVHRDADSPRGAEPRISEIVEASSGWTSAQHGGRSQVVPVVPVTMTEAWALASLFDTSEAAEWISRHEKVKVAGLEQVSDPKSMLRNVLGRHERNGALTDSEFSSRRRRTLVSMDITGSLASMPSWKRLLEDTRTAVIAVRPHYGRGR